MVLCDMLQTAMITHENKSAIQAFTRPGTCSSIISTGEDVARDTYAPVLDEQQFVDHDADLQGDFEERAGGHSSLGRWSLLTRHGGWWPWECRMETSLRKVWRFECGLKLPRPIYEPWIP